MECYCYLPNMQDKVSVGKTPHERRFGKPLEGPIVPFGSLVEYLLFPQKTSPESNNLERKYSFGIVLGYVLYAGGIWNGDIFVVDLESWKRWTHRKSKLQESMLKR